MRTSTSAKGGVPKIRSNAAKHKASDLDSVPPDLRRLQPTAVYETFWRFAAERQRVFFLRLEHHPPPWTHDPVLSVHKFTNAYRASDRVSQYLIRHVIYRADLPDEPAEVVFRRLGRAGEVQNSWFLALRTSISPHPRIRVGLNRAAVFGGTHGLVPETTFEGVVKTVVGIDTTAKGQGSFEDQVASLDVWFAPMLGPLPLVLYGEWGVGDLAAQKTEMPAIVGGLQVPGFPGARWLSLGVESASFRTSDGMRRPWYDHRVFGTWTDDGILRAHALGGAGSELRVYAGADLVEARLRFETNGFTRKRKTGNLFAPEREGSSKGAEWTLRWRVARSIDLEASGIVESGSGWTESGVFFGTRLTR